ncbi:MAG: aminotransferase class V-fold PLP-dependent enzyme [Gaiellales bacterium]
MHRWTAEDDRIAQEVLAYARDRLRLDPVPLDRPLSPRVLEELAGQTVTASGLGAEEAFRVFRDILAPATISVDNPRFLSFIPAAPSDLAMLFDLVVAASSIYGGTWLEGAGAVYAENQALRWVADLVGFPPGAGGCFVSGGTAGNLAALVSARQAALERRGGVRPARWRVLASVEAHSSVATAARVMDVEVVDVASDDQGRMWGEAVRETLDGIDDEGAVFAVVASAGTTNLGVVDDLAGVAESCRARGVWLHVDGAYGGAALAAPSARHLFDGIEQADSFVVDPHKWLFAPYDCAALIYRDPEIARRAHTQHAGYLEAITTRDEWNPSDYAVHLTRRARGLPFWFSLAAHGTSAYSAAIERTLEVARAAVAELDARPYLERVHDPMLSVIAFRRKGWAAADYERWSDRLLADGYAFVLPTRHRGETITRIAIVNPRTTIDDIRGILDSMA